jgi:SAM-dependent methyltransferase
VFSPGRSSNYAHSEGDPVREYSEGERVYLGHSDSAENEMLHLERYRFAAELIGERQTVLDAASGSGYGAQLLGLRARQVIGLELNEHALAYARSHYPRPNVEYRRADLDLPLDLPSDHVDLIVSFETIEHIRNPRGLLIEFRRILRPGGRVVVSTPDRDVQLFSNRFHTQELSRGQFVSLISDEFHLEGLYGQLRFSSSMWRRPLRSLAGWDFLNLRNSRLARLNVARALRRKLRPHQYADGGTNITDISSLPARSHVFLIAVGKKV